jgi:16S rRNA pseudouridine516 synthase
MKLLKYLEIVTDKSKNECLKLIKDKHIKVNGILITKEKTTIKEQKDEVLLDDQLLIYEEFIYLMMNKRGGLVCATNDNFQQTVIVDIKEFKNRDLHLVGRLDKDTEGLLLITDDGNFIHHLTSPKHDIVKKYYVEFSGKYKDNVKECFLEGIVLDDGEKCLPATIEKIDDNKCYINIQEGKFHQVKRMCASCGMKVEYLKRIKIGDLILDENLEVGEYRKLTTEEILMLKK